MDISDEKKRHSENGKIEIIFSDIFSFHDENIDKAELDFIVLVAVLGRGIGFWLGIMIAR
jgi:hypothetical protein